MLETVNVITSVNEMPTWNEKLEQEYLELFETGETGLPIRGIECSSGWANHVEKMLGSIKWHIQHNGRLVKNQPAYVKIFQIKEKFGQLRVYYSSPDELTSIIDNVIAAAEGKCTLTCENCGKLEYDCIKSSGGWVQCLCDECSQR